jgi:hypothetical protein
MSLYQIISMVHAMSKAGKPEPMTERDYKDGLAAIRALNLPDVKV